MKIIWKERRGLLRSRCRICRLWRLWRLWRLVFFCTPPWPEVRCVNEYVSKPRSRRESDVDAEDPLRGECEPERAQRSDTLGKYADWNNNYSLLVNDPSIQLRTAEKKNDVATSPTVKENVSTHVEHRREQTRKEAGKELWQDR